MAASHYSRWFGLNSPYEYRDSNLRAIGFRSYDAYLRSPLWASIRMRVLERCNATCEVCQRRIAAHVHHRAYDPATLRGDSIDALTAACARCHLKAEKKYKASSSEREQFGYQRLMTANDAMLRRVWRRGRKAWKAEQKARLVKPS